VRPRALREREFRLLFGIAATWFVAAPFLALSIPSIRHLREDGTNP
jgi:hypothetical protein